MHRLHERLRVHKGQVGEVAAELGGVGSAADEDRVELATEPILKSGEVDYREFTALAHA